MYIHTTYVQYWMYVSTVYVVRIQVQSVHTSRETESTSESCVFLKTSEHNNSKEISRNLKISVSISRSNNSY